MELRHFALAFKRNWALFFAWLLLGLVGPYLYNHYVPLKQASTSVAVLDPLTARPAGYVQAQVTFDEVVQSQALANAVAAKLGESPGQVSASLSVTVAPARTTSNNTVTSTVYLVHAKDRNMARAIRRANAAVAEARIRYAKLNSADGSAVLRSLSASQAAADARVKTAQDALNKFVADNNAADLPTQINTEQALVSSLQQQLYTAQSTPGRGSSTLANDLAREQNRLNHLQSLLPEYEKLLSDLQTAQGLSTALATQAQSMAVAQILPPDSLTKVIDPATGDSAGLSSLLTYALGAVCGLILGLAAIYVAVLVRPRPMTASEVADVFGAPVLGRIPGRAGR